MEKEEVSSLRRAMDAMDFKDTNPPRPDDDVHEDDGDGDGDEEKRLYNAALNEAAELVWRHQHGVKPPEPGTPYYYKPHLQKNSYAQARTASIGQHSGRESLRSLSDSSSGSEGSPSDTPRESTDQKRSDPLDVTKSRPHAGMPSGPRSGSGNHRRRSSMKRNISGEIEKPFSGDQIWEEPEGNSTEPSLKKADPSSEDAPAPFKSKPRYPLSRVQFATASPQSGAPTTPKLSRFEIHRNPPSQSRNPSYRTNTPPSSSSGTSEDVPKKNGMEIRGDDIRQATTMRLKDRSAKLPTPSAVSDSPGRPIVSFDKNWKAPEEATDLASEESTRVTPGLKQGGPGQTPTPPVPAIAVTPTAETSSAPSRPSGSPGVPSIYEEDDGDAGGPRVPGVPTISLPDDDVNSNNTPSVPVIVTPDDNDDGNRRPSARPLPTPGAGNSQARRPFGARPRGHWSPAPNNPGRSTALCHECGIPIQGRFVALKGSAERFHPECFRCYACGTALEALEISPEPEPARAERLERIRRRAAGEVLEEAPGQTMAEDGDDRLRFYCHLDWHELFAPRCRHCRTPILGEHVVALGAHWHYGHFFCAECGDPFDRGTTHIEKDGYAWCVNCQTKRTERRAPKCRGCRGPVIGQYVRALGAEWHDDCFRCSACAGGFDDGQIFPMPQRGEGVVLCTRCRAAELKM